MSLALYKIVEMKIHGNSLMSFRIEGSDGFSVWVHKDIAELKAAISANEKIYENFRSSLLLLSGCNLSNDAIENIINIIENDEKEK